MRKLKIIWALTLLTLAACLEPYAPPTTSSSLGYLVIDGFLNPADGSVTVKLSRTASLAAGSVLPGEPGGLVVLEQFNGTPRLLVDQGAGLYSLTGLTINPSARYRLSVRTKARNYLSDYVDIVTTPPIDSVYWTADVDRNGLQINVATHDPSRSAGFYMWDFVETWQHDAFFFSGYWIQQGKVVMRPPSTYVYTCYSTETSSKISIASTEKLSANKVQYPLTFKINGDPKISSIHGKYSILVRQHSLTPAAYTFYQQLQKTTENLGGLFDPQPSQVIGNMHGPANITDPVLGYFSAGNIIEKRIFIDVFKLPEFLQVKHEGCALRELEGPGAPPLSEYPDGYLIVGTGPVSTADGACGDCRVAGGTTTKPPFWP